MIKFTVNEALMLHKLIAAKTGGSVGVRDIGLVESALEGAYQTFGGVELYPSLIEKGARLGYSLISNHAFVDGNKRIGMLVMLVFLEVNGIEIGADNGEIIRVGLGVAAGEIDYEGLLEAIKKWSKK